MKGVSPAPYDSRVVPVAPLGATVRVVVGQEYELRTNAIDIDAVSGAVSYPLCYVGSGSNERAASAGMGAPFSRVSPIRVRAVDDYLVVSGDVAATVWVLSIAMPCFSGAPGGCGCAKCGGENA